jgi:hypothetical protein
MLKKFLISLQESPFIEGMGRIFDFFGVIETGSKRTMTDTEAMNEDWNKVLGDFKHFVILVEEKGNDGERIAHQQPISA